jgi:hypothetical protein
MTTEPTGCVPPNQRRQGAEEWKRRGIGSVPIGESRSARILVGIITDRDLAIQV